MKNFVFKFKTKLITQNGFSLIEVMIAMAILSIGLLSIAAMQTSAIKGNTSSNFLTVRTLSASNHLENLLNLPFNDPNLTDFTQDGIDNNGNSVIDEAAESIHDPENDGIDNDGDGIVDEADDDGEFDYSITWNVTDDTSNQKTIALTITRVLFKSKAVVNINTGRASTITMSTTKVR